jgi:hypothetical protein
MHDSRVHQYEMGPANPTRCQSCCSTSEIRRWFGIRPPAFFCGHVLANQVAGASRLLPCFRFITACFRVYFCYPSSTFLILIFSRRRCQVTMFPRVTARMAECPTYPRSQLWPHFVTRSEAFLIFFTAAWLKLYSEPTWYRAKTPPPRHYVREKGQQAQNEMSVSPLW